MDRSLKLLGVVLLLLASAQTRATLPDRQLDNLVATAIAQSPELTAARASAEAARRRIEPSRTLPDPSLSTTWQNDGRAPSLGSAEGSYLGLMLSQPLPWPGKLALAGKTATSEAREVELSTSGRAALTIEARVRNAWYDLQLAHALDRLIDDRRATARQIEETVRDRYAAGIAVQQDVIRAQVEVARIDELKAGQHAVIVSRAAELNRLLGRPADAAIEVTHELPANAPIPPASDLIASVVQRSPEAAAAKQGIETGRLRVDLAKKNFLPDLVVSGGSMYRGNFEMGPMWQVGVGISLPIWSERRQANQLAEAEARVAQQTAQTDLIARELEVRTRERIAELENATTVAALYHDKIIPLDELGLESALASYRTGKVPFVAVFDAVNALYSDRATWLGRLAESAKWRVAIDEAALEPSAIATTSMPVGRGAPGSPSSQAPASSTSATSAMTSMR